MNTRNFIQYEIVCEKNMYLKYLNYSNLAEHIFKKFIEHRRFRRGTKHNICSIKKFIIKIKTFINQILKTGNNLSSCTVLYELLTNKYSNTFLNNFHRFPPISLQLSNEIYVRTIASQLVYFLGKSLNRRNCNLHIMIPT